MEEGIMKKRNRTQFKPSEAIQRVVIEERQKLVKTHDRLSDLKVLKKEVRRFRKVIKEYCIECSGGIKSEPHYCPIKKCKLYQYREGK
jgi:hypothetical protein